MDIYQASDGGVYQLERHLRDYDGLQTLYEDVSIATNVPADHILLFMQDGKEVKNETLEEFWRQPGPSAYQAAPRIELYLYNRESFWSDPEASSLQFQEDVQLPPPMEASLISDLVHVQQPFIVAHDHLLHLHSLYQAQSHATSIAYDNLSHHLLPTIREFQKFAAQAEKDLREEEDLIKGAPVDMALLPKLVVNSAFVKRKSNSEGEEIKPKTLADYVNPRKMESVRESCRVAYDEHVERFNDLANQMDELALQSEAERRAFDEKSEIVGRDFAEGIARLEVALSQLQQLIGSGVEDVSQDFLELDQAMRDDLIALTGVKNEFTLDVHIHLRQVANFQSRLTALVPPLTQLDADLRAKGAFPHLSRLRMLPFAYATALAEVARRKEYGKALLSWAHLFVEAVTRFTSLEKTRREQLQTEVISHLPWTLPPFENATTPVFNLSVMTGAETFDSVPFGYEEVEKLVKWVEGLKQDHDVLAAMEDVDEGHLEALQTNIESLLGQVVFATEELDKMIERSVLLTRRQVRSSGSSQTLAISAQLRAANQERAEQTQRLADAESAHAARIRELEDEHEQRVASLQTRQAELQDEMVRLRTDLSDEMMARQALSAELDEKLREQEDKTRDQEDQSDLVTALQAEFAQEKDRATDLGVRLQEALLDVDGLKSAEQTLIAQLQELQEERTRSLQSLGETQLAEQTLQSQLAGVRAELSSTAQQLAQAQQDRDTALRNQLAEAERLMRDHIAETDGDRAVLEHQNLTLNKQLEDLKVEMEEKLSAAKNSAIRQADGLKAELSLTRAQLREVQRKEAVMAGELAMAQDSATAMSQERSYQADVSRDAVSLAARYHETCQRLLNAINASTTISGTSGSQIHHRSSTSAAPPPLPSSSYTNVVINSTAALSTTTSKDDQGYMRESVLVRSLATASGFDLVVFADAVQRTINLVKKWSKSCKQYRESARNKIAFTTFTKGDLALFLPTRNAAARSWAAFNLSAPHNFLRVTDAMQEEMKTREWIVARIVDTEEAIATGGDSPATNPYGLADGLRYWTHHVEEYNPSTILTTSQRNGPIRRSTSTGITTERERERERGRIKDMSSSQQIQNLNCRSPPMSTSTAELNDRPQGAGRAQSSYFPPMSSVIEHDSISAEASVKEEERSTILDHVYDLQSGTNTVTLAPHPRISSPRTLSDITKEMVKDVVQSSSPERENRVTREKQRESSNSPPWDIARTPIHPSHLSAGTVVRNDNTISVAPPPASAPAPVPSPISNSTLPPTSSPLGTAATTTTAREIPNSRRTYTHQRMSSRNSTLSPNNNTLGTSIDRDSLVARPSSVASSGGSYKPLSVALVSGGGGKSSPAPAISSSLQKGLPDLDGGMPIRQSQLRRQSSTMSLSSSTRPISDNDTTNISGSGSGTPFTRIVKSSSPSSQQQQQQKQQGFANLGIHPPTSTAGSGTASKLIRGFSIGRMGMGKLQTPIPGPVKVDENEDDENGPSVTVRNKNKTAGKDKEKPSAMDMLRRFEGGSGGT